MRFTNKKSKGCFAKNSLYFFSAFFLLSFVACKPHSQKSLTNQEWYVQQIHYAPKSEVPNISYYVVRFYPDGNFSLFSGTGFVFGKWVYASKKPFLQLHPNFGDLKIPDLFWKIELQKDNSIIFGLYPKPSYTESLKDITITCTGLTNASTKDPFNLGEHNWRRRPTAFETNEQIKTRVLAYLHFLETLYQHTLDNKMDELRYDWFPQPLRMEYSNAVRMAYSGDEMMLWNKCFYDSAQSVQAYLMIGNTMIKQQLKNTDNIADRNLDFVQQIEEKLK